MGNKDSDIIWALFCGWERIFLQCFLETHLPPTNIVLFLVSEHHASAAKIQCKVTSLNRVLFWFLHVDILVFWLQLIVSKHLVPSVVRVATTCHACLRS